MIFSLVFLLGLAHAGVADLGNVGRCRDPFEWNTLCDCKDLTEVCKENYGVWRYSKVPRTPITESFQAMILSIRPDCNKVADYIASAFYLDKCGKAGYYEYEAFYRTPDNGHYTLIQIGNRTNTYRVYNLAYVPHRMLVYYICSEDGDDCVDHRYVMSQGKLTEEEECMIKEIECKYNFVGDLINL